MSEKLVDLPCDLCLDKGPCKYLPLFPFGSEGLYVCHHCELSIVEFIRQMRRDYSRLRERIRESKP